jgi:hypothetical protein
VEQDRLNVEELCFVLLLFFWSVFYACIQELCLPLPNFFFFFPFPYDYPSASSPSSTNSAVLFLHTSSPTLGSSFSPTSSLSRALSFRSIRAAPPEPARLISLRVRTS